VVKALWLARVGGDSSNVDGFEWYFFMDTKRILSAYVGTWAENIAYYGTIAARDWKRRRD